MSLFQSPEESHGQHKVILNPYSNRWQAREKWPLVEEELNKAGIKFELAMSRHPGGHVIELAAEAVQQGIFAHHRGRRRRHDRRGGQRPVTRRTRQPHPARPGRDSSRWGPPMTWCTTSSCRLDIPGAVAVIAAGKTSKLDVCQVNTRLFVNNSAIGLEPTVTLIQQEMKQAKGIVRYLLATLRAINRNPSWQARLEWDGGHYEGPISLVTVGNGAVTGGHVLHDPACRPLRWQADLRACLPQDALGDVEDPAAHDETRGRAAMSNCRVCMRSTPDG